MSFLDALAEPHLKELVEEVRLCRDALQTIAAALVSLTAVPAMPPLPTAPLGPEAIGSYAQMVMEAEDEESMRQILRDQGLTDPAIEEKLVQFMFEQESLDEESTS